MAESGDERGGRVGDRVLDDFEDGCVLTGGGGERLAGWEEVW